MAALLALSALTLADKIKAAHGNIDIGLVPITAPADLVTDVSQLALLLKAAGANVAAAPLAVSGIGAVSGFANIMHELEQNQSIVAASFPTSIFPKGVFAFEDTLDVFVVRRTAAPNGLHPIVLPA